MNETQVTTDVFARSGTTVDKYVDKEVDSGGDGAAGGADKRYAKLVRLAYLVLPATGRRSYRLAIAQRIVDASLPRRSWSERASEHAYAPIRCQVVRQAMRPSPWLRIGLGSRLRRLPKPGPTTPARLAALDPAVRAAYVLRRVESLPRSIVRDQLVRIGVPDAMEVVKAADQVPELSLPRVAPGPALSRRSRIPLGVAGALTIAALVAAQAGRPGHPDPASAPPATRPAAQPPAQPAARPAVEVAPRPAVAAFWAGLLPGGVRARWICRRVVVPGRPPRSAGILIVGAGRQSTDCGHVHGTTVGGTWWRAAGGRWYFLGAAGHHFLVTVVPPPSFAYRVPGVRRGLVVVPGPHGGARPPHGRMTVTAHRM